MVTLPADEIDPADDIVVPVSIVDIVATLDASSSLLAADRLRFFCFLPVFLRRLLPEPCRKGATPVGNVAMPLPSGTPFLHTQ